MKTLLRRAAATGVPMGSLVKVLVTFATTVPPRERPSAAERHSSPEASVRAPARPAAREALGLLAALRLATRVTSTCGPRRHDRAAAPDCEGAITRDPDAPAYMDQALTPVGDDDDETLDLLTKTTGGARAVAHVKKVAELTGATKVA